MSKKISGAVTDALTELPIVGATVSVISDGIVIVTAKTDAIGNYSFTDLTPGSYTVMAVATAYKSASFVVMVSDSGISVLNISLLTNMG